MSQQPKEETVIELYERVATQEITPNQARVLFMQLLAQTREEVLDECLQAFDDLIAHGHGGGNWRRIIEMKRAAIAKLREGVHV